jgi:hypothetical protein
MLLSLFSCDLPSDLVQMEAQNLPNIVDTGLVEPVPEAEFDTAGEVYELLSGTFDSTEQASSDPRFYAISMQMCAVDVPVVGTHVLYVERATFRDLMKPFRQHFYSIETIENGVALNVYSIDPQIEPELVGTCDVPNGITINPDRLKKREGCTIWLELDGEGYSGGTVGDDCDSTVSGAAYDSTQMVLEKERIEVWERGWDRQNNQVWGSVKGPYIFDRNN